MPHVVVIRRSGSYSLSVTIDGISVGNKASMASFGVLPSLESAIDPWEGVDGTVGLSGSVDGVCLWALKEAFAGASLTAFPQVGEPHDACRARTSSHWSNRSMRRS
ncbi:MAG: hypothetical protein ACREJ3_17730 [Polyangiaceae bacterium]